jgi:hypothetical protein
MWVADRERSLILAESGMKKRYVGRELSDT